MYRILSVLTVLFFSVNAFSLSAEEQLIAKLLTSKDETLHKFAVKEVSVQPSADQELYDFVANKLIVALDKKGANSDLLAWYARALGSSKSKRYVATLNYALNTSTNKKELKHFNRWKGKLTQDSNEIFDASYKELEAKTKEYRAFTGNPPSLEIKLELFSKLQVGAIKNNVIQVLGFPNKQTNEYFQEKLFPGTKSVPGKRRRVYVYNNVGRLIFYRNQVSLEWELEQKMLYLPKSSNVAANVSQLGSSDTPQLIDDLWSWNYTALIRAYEKGMRASFDEQTLDLFAQRAWYGRYDSNKALVKAFQHMLLVLQASGNSRYLTFLDDLTADDRVARKIRKTSRKVAKKIRGETTKSSSAKQFSPIN